MSNSDARKYVIVGNGFAGTTCAEQLRKHEPSCEITLFGDEPYTLYNRISLPPMLRHQIPEAKVMIRNLAWHEENRIDLHLRTRVDRVVPEENIVEAGGKRYPYDALLIATGGRPNPTGKPGSEGASNLYPFQYLDDTRAISEQIDRSKAGVASADRLSPTSWPRHSRRGVSRRTGSCAARMGCIAYRRGVAGELLHDSATAEHVHMHYGHEVDEFIRSNGEITKVRTNKGMEIEAQCYAYGFGLAMNTEILDGSGIEISKNGLLCDDHLETNIKGIYAAGDVADFYDPILEMRYRMGTWNNSGAHGKVVAQNMMGGSEKYHDVPEYSSLLLKADHHAVRARPRPSAESRNLSQGGSREEMVSRAILLGRSPRRRTNAW